MHPGVGLSIDQIGWVLLLSALDSSDWVKNAGCVCVSSIDINVCMWRGVAPGTWPSLTSKSNDVDVSLKCLSNIITLAVTCLGNKDVHHSVSSLFTKLPVLSSLSSLSNRKLQGQSSFDNKSGRKASQWLQNSVNWRLLGSDYPLEKKVFTKPIWVCVYSPYLSSFFIGSVFVSVALHQSRTSAYI